MPSKIGTYRILRRLGTEGFVEVFLAEDTNPSYQGDRVSVKRVLSELAATDPLYRKGLLDEGEAGRAISHPNVVQTYDVVLEDDIAYLVTEYVDGILLSELIEAAGGRVDAAAVAEIGRQICEGLRALHEANDKDGNPLEVIHQNVKPDNICINRRGDAKILDLGIARATVQGQGGIRIESPAPAYMSPEQARGDSDLSAASDQYSVGVLVFEMLSGIPFLSALEALAKLAEKRAALDGEATDDDDSIQVRLDDVLEGDIKDGGAPFATLPPKEYDARLDWARRELPGHLNDLEELPGSGLDEVLSQILAYDPEDRYSSAPAAGADLLRWAWGTGNAIDFREFVTEMIASCRGEEDDEEPGDGPSEDSAMAAAESSFIPKSVVLSMVGDSAFLPPSPATEAGEEVQRRGLETPNLAAPEPVSAPLPAPGALLAVDESGAAPDSASNASGSYAEDVPEPQKAVRRMRLVLAGAGVLIVALLAGIGFLWQRSQKPATSAAADAAPDAAAEIVPLSSRVEDEPAGNAEPESSNELRSLFESVSHKEPEPKPETLPAQFRGLRPSAEQAAPVVEPDTGLAELPDIDLIEDGLPQKLPPEEDEFKRYRGARWGGPMGSVTIETSPPGAIVILNGETRERSPITFDAIPSGKHKIVMRSEELGKRAELIIEVRSRQHWGGTWSFRESRWISRE